MCAKYRLKANRLVLSLHYIHPGNESQVTWLGSKHLYMQNHLDNPLFYFFFVGGTEIGALMVSFLSLNFAYDYGCVKLEQQWSLG